MVWREVCACSGLSARARMTGNGYEIAQGGYALYYMSPKSQLQERKELAQIVLGELSRYAARAGIVKVLL